MCMTASRWAAVSWSRSVCSGLAGISGLHRLGVSSDSTHFRFYTRHATAVESRHRFFASAVRCAAMDSPDTQTPPAPAATSALDSRMPPGVPKPRRRWIIGIICLLTPLAIPMAAFFYLAWQQDRELQALMAELDRTDPHWRFDDLMAQRPPIADTDNPALVVMKVDALVRPNGYGLSPKHEKLLVDPMPPERRLNGMQVAALRETLAKHAAAIKLARTLKDFRSEGRHAIKVSPDYLSTNLEPLQRTRGVMWMLQHDAMQRVEEEDGAGAMESCRALLVATRSLGQEPYLIAALIRYAGQAITVNALERTLAQTEPPEPQAGGDAAAAARDRGTGPARGAARRTGR